MKINNFIPSATFLGIFKNTYLQYQIPSNYIASFLLPNNSSYYLYLSDDELFIIKNSNDNNCKYNTKNYSNSIKGFIKCINELQALKD